MIDSVMHYSESAVWKLEFHYKSESLYGITKITTFIKKQNSFSLLHDAKFIAKNDTATKL